MVEHSATNRGPMAAEDRILGCARGGGYISGSRYSHRKMYAHYAKKIGCRALIVNYCLAYENRHPGPVNDMAKAYSWPLDQGITPNHLAIAILCAAAWPS
jgi:epsilon-lactone hydrolase